MTNGLCVARSLAAAPMTNGAIRFIAVSLASETIGYGSIIATSIALRYAAGLENVEVNTIVTGCSGSSCLMNLYVFSSTAGGTRGPPEGSGASGSSAEQNTATQNSELMNAKCIILWKLGGPAMYHPKTAGCDLTRKISVRSTDQFAGTSANTPPEWR